MENMVLFKEMSCSKAHMQIGKMKDLVWSLRTRCIPPELKNRDVTYSDS